MLRKKAYASRISDKSCELILTPHTYHFDDFSMSRLRTTGTLKRLSAELAIELYIEPKKCEISTKTFTAETFGNFLTEKVSRYFPIICCCQWRIRNAKF